jgi:hypothetical protein
MIKHVARLPFGPPPPPAGSKGGNGDGATAPALPPVFAVVSIGQGWRVRCP